MLTIARGLTMLWTGKDADYKGRDLLKTISGWMAKTLCLAG
jgi:hypothetical protein